MQACRKKVSAYNLFFFKGKPKQTYKLMFAKNRTTNAPLLCMPKTFERDHSSGFDVNIPATWAFILVVGHTTGPFPHRLH